MCILLITTLLQLVERHWDPLNKLNPASWLTIVTPADFPKSVCHRFLIEHLVGFSSFFFIFDVPLGRGFHKTESDLFPFLFIRFALFLLITPKYSLISNEGKGRDLTQSYDKSPNTQRKIQKATLQHKNATKNFDCTTIVDRLRTVSCSNDSHPIGGVKPVYGISTFPLTTKAE